jgi:hypothetical protein
MADGSRRNATFAPRKLYKPLDFLGYSIFLRSTPVVQANRTDRFTLGKTLALDNKDTLRDHNILTHEDIYSFLIVLKIQDTK